MLILLCSVCIIAHTHLLCRSSLLYGIFTLGSWQVLASYLRLLYANILTTGEKGKRHCLPNASIMIHRKHLSQGSWQIWTLISAVEPSGGASGQASDIAIHAKEILRVRELLTRIYQRHCSKGDESVEAGMERFGELTHPRCNVHILF